MRYMTVEECRQIGREPYAVYGGRVYSFKAADGRVIPHGCYAYAQAVVAAMRDASPAARLDGLNATQEPLENHVAIGFQPWRVTEDCAVAAMVAADDKQTGYERARHMLKAAIACMESHGVRLQFTNEIKPG